MMDRSWIGVACILCPLLGLLVWHAQHVLNTFHPWEDFRCSYRCSYAVPVRLGLLLVRWLAVAAVLAALVLSTVFSLPGGMQILSVSLLHWTLRIAVLGSGVLIMGASTVSAVFWGRRHR